MPSVSSGAYPIVIATEVSQYDEIPVGSYVRLELHPESKLAMFTRENWDKLTSVTGLTVLKAGIQVAFNLTGHGDIEFTYIEVGWDQTQNLPADLVVVAGLRIIFVCKNIGAGMTGAELLVILLAIAIFTALMAGVVLVVWGVKRLDEITGGWSWWIVLLGIFLIIVLWLSKGVEVSKKGVKLKR